MSLRSSPTFPKGAHLSAVAIVGFLLYASFFIYRTSFDVDGERYFSLFDDAMISMRYARNLAHGLGLVWNPGGARVEGYTDPLWVLFMSFIHSFDVADSKASLFVQIAAAAFLAANLFVVRRIALAVSDGSEAASLGAVLLTAFYLPLNNWALQGMEVSVLVFLMSLTLWWALRSMRNGHFSIGLYLLLGASTLVRPDMVVPFATIMLFLAVVDRGNRRRHLLWGSLVLLFFWAAQALFRLWYFGYPLPNTYYLKLEGYPLLLRITRGLYVLGQFIWNTNIALFALPFLLGLGGDRRVLLLLWFLLVQMAYSVYVGGDAWEFWGGSNRYIAIAMPGFFVLLACGLLHVSRFIGQGLAAAPGFGGIATRRWRGAIFPVLIAVSLLSINAIYGFSALLEAFLLKAPLQSGPGGENELDVREALDVRRITNFGRDHGRDQSRDHSLFRRSRRN